MTFQTHVKNLALILFHLLWFFVSIEIKLVIFHHTPPTQSLASEIVSLAVTNRSNLIDLSSILITLWSINYGKNFQVKTLMSHEVLD